MHDQEKGYSPAFRRQGERESSERKRLEALEEERKIKCGTHEEFYNEYRKYLDGKESRVKGNE
jgi:hypothetical protein